ncbi:hypothetical protein ACP0HM_19695 [Escherichia coli]
MYKQASPLYQIDPATYQANYDSAKGELAKSEAAAAIAHLTVKRYVPLVGTKYISQQEYDRAIADARRRCRRDCRKSHSRKRSHQSRLYQSDCAN